MTSSNSHQKFISYALNLAKNNLGLTAPNPVVGCVILKDGQIISSGVTAKNGRPHAEKIAIDKITDKQTLNGAEIYVTLEPCSHKGETDPCVDEIIKYRFKKVVISTQDTDKRVNGNGIKKLQDAGIEVVCGVLEKEAREINRGFFKAKKTDLPFVTMKLATSLDGKIATKDFDSKWITSKKAREFSHHLRAINDAIIVGANTARKDDPMLDCRLLGLEEYSPKRVVIAGEINFSQELKIFQTAKKIPTIILTFKQNFDFTNLEKLGVEIIFCEKKNDRIDLIDGCKKLCLRGVNSILIEGGQNLATQFLAEKLVDELVWIRSKKIIGDDGISAIGALKFSLIDEALNSFARKEVRDLEDDLIEIYQSIPDKS